MNPRCSVHSYSANLKLLLPSAINIPPILLISTCTESALNTCLIPFPLCGSRHFGWGLQIRACCALFSTTALPRTAAPSYILSKPISVPLGLPPSHSPTLEEEGDEIQMSTRVSRLVPSLDARLNSPILRCLRSSFFDSSAASLSLRLPFCAILSGT